MDVFSLVKVRESIMSPPSELLVSVDIGSREHSVAIGLRDGSVIDLVDWNASPRAPGLAELN